MVHAEPSRRGVEPVLRPAQPRVTSLEGNPRIDPAARDQGRLTSLRAELRPNTGRQQTRTTDRLVDDAPWFPLHRVPRRTTRICSRSRLSRNAPFARSATRDGRPRGPQVVILSGRDPRDPYLQLPPPIGWRCSHVRPLNRQCSALSEPSRCRRRGGRTPQPPIRRCRSRCRPTWCL